MSLKGQIITNEQAQTCNTPGLQCMGILDMFRPAAVRRLIKAGYDYHQNAALGIRWQRLRLPFDRATKPTS